jgi:hypothetical protein
VGLDECTGVVEIVGRGRATPMLVSNEINLTLIGVAVSQQMAVHSLSYLLTSRLLTICFSTASPSPSLQRLFASRLGLTASAALGNPGSLMDIQASEGYKHSF